MRCTEPGHLAEPGGGPDPSKASPTVAGGRQLRELAHADSMLPGLLEASASELPRPLVGLADWGLWFPV